MWARSFRSTVTMTAQPPCWRHSPLRIKLPRKCFRTLAEARDRQGKPEQAYRAYSRATEIDPNSEDGYIAFAEFASAHGNDDYALQVVARGLEHVPESPGLLFEQGILRALRGDRSQAENSFTQASRLKPGWNLPLLAVGVSRLEAGDATQAADMFQKVCIADRAIRAQSISTRRPCLGRTARSQARLWRLLSRRSGRPSESIHVTRARMLCSDSYFCARVKLIQPHSNGRLR